MTELERRNPVELSEETRVRIDALVATCVAPREATIQALELVQGELGWVPPEAAGYVATRLGLSRADIDDVMSFYTVFHREQVGRYVIRVCHTLPCALVGAERLIDYLREKLGVEPGGTTDDGRFTLYEVECLGLCEQAPAMMINDRTYGRLTPERVDAILEALGTEDEARG